MAAGDQADFVGRIRAVLPQRWFPLTEAGSASATPVLDGILNGLASAWSWFYGLYSYVALQARLATSTDVWLDILSRDFLGTRVPRNVNEGDDLFRARVQSAILAPRATRAAIIQVVTNLTGRAPTVFQPRNTGDTGAFAQNVRTNLLSNGSAAGVSAGSPGTSPTNWTIQRNDAGLTQSIVGVGIESGIPYFDLAISGTPGSSSAVNVWLDTSPGPAVTRGQTYTQSVYLALRSGVLPGAPYIQMNLSTAGGTGDGAMASGALTPGGGVLGGGIVSFTAVAPGGVCFFEPLLRVPFSSGVPVNFVLRIGGAQLETGSSVTAFIPSAGSPLMAAGQCGLGYGAAGGYGCLLLPFQFFVTAYRPHGGGIAAVTGWGSQGSAGLGEFEIGVSSVGLVGAGGYGVGAIEYADTALIEGMVTDAMINAAIANTVSAGNIAWTAITS